MPKQINELIERFDRNIKSYRNQAYNETQVRREFIDPFFEAHGWDVTNRAGYAEAYKDVIHEDAIKIGSATKAPDYCFRIGGVRKFFVETKKPAINVKEDISPAYQLRRYAWSAKLPLSILADFEEFAVYDCRIKPKPNDKSSIGRILYLTYRDYADRWDEIAAIFSKDAVLRGSFDQFTESRKGKRGTSQVDVEFLIEIEAWRDSLARNLALRNPDLTVRDLNFAVQRTIDRIIFLRMCEDRGIEPYGQLLSLLNGENTYDRLRYLYGLADDRYNSGLFHFKPEKGRAEAPDGLTPTLIIDDKALKDIIRRLYYPESPYEFSVLSADILGNVYEQFLGKVIRLTAGHRAVIEEKPEVKKSGGVFYTPAYIVDYIVKNTVGKIVGADLRVRPDMTDTDNKGAHIGAPLQNMTPKQISKIRILDPACGSGSFLIGAYTYLLNYHRDWYVKDGPEKHTKEVYQGVGGQWLLATQEKRRILLNNIYGVDIDSQAVEVTKLSLLLKVLEGENQETLSKQLRMWRERALPDLGNNIKCGNSLIGPDYWEGRQVVMFDEEEARRVNAFDWKAEFPDIFPSTSGRGKGEGGFDVVIGNPPYGASLSEDETSYLLSHLIFQDYQLDTYLLFIEKSLTLVRQTGFLGMIIPNTWLLNLQSNRIREHLFTRSQIEGIVHYRRPVFLKATVDTEIIIIKRNISSDTHQIKITIVDKDNSTNSYVVSQKRWRDRKGQPVNIFERTELIALTDKLRDMAVLDAACVITQGAKPFQVGKGKPPQTRKTVDEKPFVSERRRDSTFRPLLRGSLIQRYKILWDKDYWISFGDWLAEPRYSAQYDAAAKIVIRQTGDSLTATMDRDKFIVRDNLYTIIPRDNVFDLRYVLGLLNSRLLNWVYQAIINPEKGEALAQVKRGHLAQLPIPLLTLSNPADKARYDKLVAQVERMLDMHNRLKTAKTPDDKTHLQRQIDATDKQIDGLVYELYGLTEEEIRIVEGDVKDEMF
ncbi:MAG: N-6 DNA methylase [Nitrospirae bacterium]|nr:N-6 DNA methylase [Nitrospirota bacterium]